MSVSWTFKKKTLPSTVLELEKKKKGKRRKFLAITTLERKKNE